MRQLCVINIFSKHAWVVPLKDKKGVNIVNDFKKILKDPNNGKPRKIWADKGSEFYNISFKNWLQDNNIEMYSTHNEGKSVVAEIFIRTLNNKIYKYMTSLSKNMYIDKLDDMVIDIDFGKELNDKDRKFKVGDHVRISTYKKTFAKGYTPNWYEQTFVIKKIKNTVPWTYVINDHNGEEIIGTFYENVRQKTNQQEFKVINYISNGKGMIVHLIAGLIKKTWYKSLNIFLNQMNLLVEINVKVDLTNYATKTYLKNTLH